jgi:hypothetical protein
LIFVENITEKLRKENEDLDNKLKNRTPQQIENFIEILKKQSQDIEKTKQDFIIKTNEQKNTINLKINELEIEKKSKI